MANCDNNLISGALPPGRVFYALNFFNTRLFALLWQAIYGVGNCSAVSEIFLENFLNKRLI
jgi:hypothetical protein